MRTIKQLPILVSVLLLFAIACTESLTKDRYLHNYETWVGNLKQDYKDYKEADWSQAETEFKQYSESDYNKFKGDFSPEERQKIDLLTGQYYALLAKYKANQLKDELRSIINKAKGMFEELQKE